MFVSASLLVDYRSERPSVAVRPLTAVRRGLSGTGWNSDGVLGRDRAGAKQIDGARRGETRCKPVSGPGESDATDPLAEIRSSSARWASSAWCRSNSTGERYPS